MRYFKADYVKVWPGQDGWDYPFQVDHGTLWKHSLDGIGQLASENPDLKFVIEYKPREPRVLHELRARWRARCSASRRSACPMSASCSISATPSSAARSPPNSAQMAIDYGRLFGMDVNDNYRSWDDDLVAGSLHPIELFEFFHVLRKNKWKGVWQLDQFPFREDSVAAADPRHRFPQGGRPGLDALDIEALEGAGGARRAHALGWRRRRCSGAL